MGGRDQGGVQVNALPPNPEFLRRIAEFFRKEFDPMTCMVLKEAAKEIEELRAQVEICRKYHDAMRSISWRLFADQYKGPDHWDMTAEERQQAKEANKALDEVFGKWEPPDTPENRERLKKWAEV